ncbi:MAG: amidohydrolase family protein [Rhodobacteraceae bacterium]|nr:amidohydrolase family protein [Paracoccaceae bacterium]
MPRLVTGRSARLVAPTGAVDTHIHFFYPPYDVQPAAGLPPQPATLEDYAVIQARLGVRRAVVVQPNAYQFDNRCTLGSLRRLGADQARAIVAIRPDQTAMDLKQLDEEGVCGVRIMTLGGGAIGFENIRDIAERIAPLGWHLNVQFDGREMVERAEVLQELPCPFVIDHTGKYLTPVTPEDPAFTALLRLVDRGDVYVKLSAPYETSQTGAPAFDDVGALAKRLVAHAPERMMWASNWPHVSVTADNLPDDADLLDVLLEWAPDQEIQHKILVENPNRFYGFE